MYVSTFPQMVLSLEMVPSISMTLREFASTASLILRIAASRAPIWENLRSWTLMLSSGSACSRSPAADAMTELDLSSYILKRSFISFSLRAIHSWISRNLASCLENVPATAEKDDSTFKGVDADVDLTNACVDIIPTRANLSSAPLDLSLAPLDLVVDREKQSLKLRGNRMAIICGGRGGRTATGATSPLPTSTPIRSAARGSNLNEGGDDGVADRWIRWKPSIPRDSGIRPRSPVPGRSNDPVISLFFRHRCIGAKPRCCGVNRNVNRIATSRRNIACRVTRSSFLWLASQCRFVPT